MKIHVLSDLHLEFLPFTPSEVDSDVVVLAGDIHVSARSSVPEWARKTFPGKPVIWVAGNHEHYRWRNGIEDNLAHARLDASVHEAIHFLENDSVVIGGVRFLGCTLWTDFNLHGTPVQSELAALSNILDFCGAICTLDADGSTRRFLPRDSVAIHRDSVRWLDHELSTPFSGKTVVVTHHSPHPECEHAFYKTSTLSPVFCSDLGWLIAKHEPALWISGHTHASHRISVGKTLLVSNQRGYSNTPEHEDAPFDPGLVVEV